MKLSAKKYLDDKKIKTRIKEKSTNKMYYNVTKYAV